ncbi:hypothetical protein ABEK27_23800, partial [Klebsiella pneumoniae]
MMSLWDALRMNMMISYQELVRTFPNLEGKGLCSLNRERQERFFNIKAGEKKTARVFTDANGDLDIRPTTIN